MNLLKNIQQLCLMGTIVLALSNCKEKVSEAPQYYSATPEQIHRSMEAFWTYTMQTVNLADDFDGYDSAGTALEKKYFLNEIAVGKSYAVRMKAEGNKMIYRLYPFTQSVDPDIRRSSMQVAKAVIDNLSKEGQMIPDLKLPDLVGNMVDLSKLRGEVIVLKFWFIQCHACIEEFPYVNSLVAKYPNYKFISVALDDKPALVAFLKGRKLDYSVVANAQSFNTALKVGIWPTHIVVDRTGRIVRYVNNAKDMVKALDKLM